MEIKSRHLVEYGGCASSAQLGPPTPSLVSKASKARVQLLPPSVEYSTSHPGITLLRENECGGL